MVRRPRARTWVGEPTVVAILGSRVAGGLLDQLAAAFGYRVQEARGITEPMLAPNLYEPVRADVAARGVFGRQSISWSPQTWAVTHRRSASALGLAATAAGVAGAATVALRRRSG